jgi:hypothetical protein
MGDDSEERLIISLSRLQSLWIVGICSYQDDFMSTKTVIHEIFGEKLVILSVVTFKNLKSSVPEL